MNAGSKGETLARAEAAGLTPEEWVEVYTCAKLEGRSNNLQAVALHMVRVSATAARSIVAWVYVADQITQLRNEAFEAVIRLKVTDEREIEALLGCRCEPLKTIGKYHHTRRAH